MMNDQAAHLIIGKTVLICLTFDPAPTVHPERKQLFGTIVSASDKEGIIVRLQGSEETYALPPFIEDLEKANPGQYQLKSTGQVVINPDYLAFWVVQRYN
ncbi:hypothetical protein WDW37_11225 [Bdellovibrionota bacterium FG-1]